MCLQFMVKWTPISAPGHADFTPWTHNGLGEFRFQAKTKGSPVSGMDDGK